MRLPQALAADAGGQREVRLEVTGTASLEQVLTLLRAAAPGVGRRVQDETGAIRRFVNVVVGEDECRGLAGLATPVPPGTVLFVIPSIAGGACEVASCVGFVLVLG